MTLDEAVAATGGAIVCGRVVVFVAGVNIEVGVQGSDGTFRLTDEGSAYLATLGAPPTAEDPMVEDLEPVLPVDPPVETVVDHAQTLDTLLG